MNEEFFFNYFFFGVPAIFLIFFVCMMIADEIQKGKRK